MQNWRLALPFFKLAWDCSTFSGIFTFFLGSVTIPGMAFRAQEAFSPPSVLVLKAKLDSRSSQLDDSPWGTDVTSFTSKSSASLSITFSINCSSASFTRLRIICISSNTYRSCLAAVSRHLGFFFHYSQSLSASHTAQEPSWRFTAHSFLRPVTNLAYSSPTGKYWPSVVFCPDLVRLGSHCHDLVPIFPSTALALMINLSWLIGKKNYMKVQFTNHQHVYKRLIIYIIMYFSEMANNSSAILGDLLG